MTALHLACRFCTVAVAFAAAILAMSTSGKASELTAVIEEVSAGAAGVSAFEMIEAGRTIQLAQTEHVVVSYFASCLRETITGGTITIGSIQSTVAHGTVERVRVPCDGGKLVLNPAEAGKSATLVFRDDPRTIEDLRERAYRIYSDHPAVFAPTCRLITVERLDQPTQSITIEVRDNWVDFAGSGKKLAPGGLYRLSGGGRETIIAIEIPANGSRISLPSRLVAL